MEERQIWLPDSAKRDLLKRAVHDGAVGVTEYEGERYAIMRADDPLLKSIRGAQAQPQAYRVNSAMHQLGLYEGIREVRSATLRTHAVLRMVPQRNPIIAAILRRRQNQVAAYCRLPRWKGDTGFRVRLRDSDRSPTAAATKEMKRIERIILNGGVRSRHARTGEPGVWDAEGGTKAMCFQQANRALVWDSMCLDAAAVRFEIGQDKKHFPVVWMSPIDAALVRYAIPKDVGKHAENSGMSFMTRPYHADIRRDEKDIAYVLMDDAGQSVQREFKWDECSYLVRNPRTDSWVQGYGYSEIEMLIDVISGILFGMKYNLEFFDTNHVPVGLLSLVGDYTDAQLDDLRRQFKMMVGGASQFWAMPIVTSKEGQAANYIPMRQDTEGMKWMTYIQFCVSICTALFGMDATELGMTNFGQSTSALGQTDTEERLQSQQEYGLVPLLAAFEAFWDEAVVQKFDDDFRFEWQNVSTENSEEKRAEDSFRFQMGVLTPNEWRAANDEPPIRDALDVELYTQIEQYVRGRLDDDDGTQEPEVLRLVQLAYEKQGGKWAKWPDAPVGNPSALQIWQTEHGIGQDEGMDMDPSMMGGDPNDPNAQGQDGEEEATPPHRYAFPGTGEEQPQAPVPGDQTSVPGKAQPAVRPGERPQEPRAMQKSLASRLFDISVRRRGTLERPR